MDSATLDKLKDDAIELLKEFGIQYLKSFGIAMFEKIKEEVEGGDDKEGLKLTYRDWDSVERPTVFEGECYMKAGEGPGCFGGWKKVYLVERQDYNIDVFPDQKAAKGGKKPKKTIKTAGYSLARDVSWHYRWDMRGLGAGLGLTEEEIALLTTFSPYSWALTHSVRENYIFQLHEGKNAACPCFGGNVVEPADAGAEFADSRPDWLEFMDRSVANSSPRDTDEIVGAAFDKTINKMSDKVRNLWGWSDDGTEADILTDMLVEGLLPNVRDDVLGNLAGPVSIRIGLWYKARGAIVKALSPLTPPAWEQCQKGAKAAGDKIEPVVRAGVEPILKAKEELKDKVRSAISDKMGEFLGKTVSPFIGPVLKILDQPLVKGFEHGKSIYSENMVLANLPDDQKQRNLTMDHVPRTWSVTYDMRHASWDLVEPLNEFKKLDSDLFDFIDPYSLRGETETTLLTTLDAAVYTLQLKLNENGKSDAFYGEVLADFESDIKIQRVNVMKSIVMQILVGGFKKALSPVVDPIIGPIDDQIPDDMKDILSVAALYEEIVDLFVGDPIGKMVEQSYAK